MKKIKDYVDKIADEIEGSKEYIEKERFNNIGCLVLLESGLKENSIHINEKPSQAVFISLLSCLSP